MAVKAVWLLNNTYLPSDDRLGRNALMTPAGTDQTSHLDVRAGVIARPAASTGGPLRVTPGGSRTVNVNIGQIVVSAGTGRGAYIVTNDAVVNLAIAPAHASLPRIDVVYVLVTDTTYGSFTDDAVIAVAAGTPASSPGLPSIPAGAQEIGRVSVPAGLTVVSAGNITDTRVLTVPAGHPLPVTSTTRPAFASVGQQIFETDTGGVQTYNGSGWSPAAANGSGVLAVPYASRPGSPAIGQRIVDPTTGEEWIYRVISGTGYWCPPNDTVILAYSGSLSNTVSGPFTDIPLTTVFINKGITSGTTSIKPLIPGRYEMYATNFVPANSTAGFRTVTVYKNTFTGNPGTYGSNFLGGQQTTAQGLRSQTRATFSVNGTSDILRAAVQQNTGVNQSMTGDVALIFLGT